MFRGISISDEFINNILGKPVTDNGNQIGVIIGANPKTDTIYMEVNDSYKDKFIETQSIEIEGEIS